MHGRGDFLSNVREELSIVDFPSGSVCITLRWQHWPSEFCYFRCYTRV
jgi:hypothetical protein